MSPGAAAAAARRKGLGGLPVVESSEVEIGSMDDGKHLRVATPRPR